MKLLKSEILFAAAVATLTSACGSSSGTAPSSSTSSFSATQPSAIMGALAASVATVGSGLSGSVSAHFVPALSSVKPRLSSSDCDQHGEPVGTSGSSDSKYAGLMAYCKMTTDTGDEESIQGVFSGIQDIACMVEHASPTYDGVAHNVTLTFDSNCFTSSKLSNMGVPSGTTVTASVIASSPAAFNTHYDRGVDINVNVGGNHHYTFGTKVTGNVIEVTYFDEDKDYAHKTGAGAGYLDLDNGILRVESRMDRILCSQSSSCGWNRHFRIYSTLNMDGLTPKDPKEIDFIYSNVSSNTLGAQGAWDGYLITASGDLSGAGVKPRGFVTGSRSNDSQVNTLGNWSENVSNGDCFTDTSTSATTCGTGIAKMSTNLKFVMAVSSGYTLPTNWFATESGLSFNSVSADSDTQY